MTKPFRPVIKSLLETDLYKFTMQQAMLHAFPANDAEYSFLCRNETAFPLADLVDEVNAQLDHLCSLRFQRDELDYLANLRFIKPDYVQFLRLFQFNRDFIEARADGEHLAIVATGPQIHVMGFEIYVLAIVNELYFRRIGADLNVGRARLAAKVALLKDFTREIQGPAMAGWGPFEVFDFGVRRRFSGPWQDEVVGTLKARVPEFFKGTSNVFLAMKHGLTAIGTQAHEWLQSWQAAPGVQLKYFQKAALDGWVTEYRGDLGIALTDIVGMDAFLADFELFHAKLWDTRELVSWTSNCEFKKLWTWTNGVNWVLGVKGIFSNGEEGEPWGGQLAELSTPLRRGGRLSPPRRLGEQPRCFRAGRPGRVSHLGGAITRGCAVVAVRQIASLA